MTNSSRLFRICSLEGFSQSGSGRWTPRETNNDPKRLDTDRGQDENVCGAVVRCYVQHASNVPDENHPVRHP